MNQVEEGQSSASQVLSHKEILKISERYHFSQEPFLDVVFVPSELEKEFINFVKEKFGSTVLQKNTCPGGIHISLKSIVAVDVDWENWKPES